MTIQTFGQFVLSHDKAPGSLGDLAQAAARDPRFPRNGSPREVSAQLNRAEAPIEFHEALEELEMEWRNRA